jgi:ribonucleoside-diphosphate reductase alpha chain
LKAASFKIVQQTQEMLSSLGIRSYYTTNRAHDVKFANGIYECKESYDLNISTDRDKFRRLIGFLQKYKQEKLAAVCDRPKGKYSHSRPKTTYEIVSREYLGDEEVFDITVEDAAHVYWTGGLLVSNCAEISLNPKLIIDEETRPLLEKKLTKNVADSLKAGDEFTGWAMCNLCELNAAKFTNLDDFMLAAKAATIIGTLQASYTSMPYLGWVSEIVAEREALLGIGMTGMLDRPDISTNPEFQRAVAAATIKWNTEYAAKIGIRPAARITTVKPSGTTSLELGGVASGHHAHHAKRYIRRVVANELETVFQAFRKVNPHMCVRKPNGDWVVEFPVEAPEGAIVKEDLSALDFLAMVKSTQQNWVLPGTARPASSPGLNHNVSNTVSVKPEEWDSVAEFLWHNREFFTGVSLLPSTGDKDYAFAPHEACVTEADEARWNQLVDGYTPLDYSAILEMEDGTSLTAEAACSAGGCEK